MSNTITYKSNLVELNQLEVQLHRQHYLYPYVDTSRQDYTTLNMESKNELLCKHMNEKDNCCCFSKSVVDDQQYTNPISINSYINTRDNIMEENDCKNCYCI
jgi:hypothetical protein